MIESDAKEGWTRKYTIHTGNGKGRKRTEKESGEGVVRGSVKIETERRLQNEHLSHGARKQQTAKAGVNPEKEKRDFTIYQTKNGRDEMSHEDKEPRYSEARLLVKDCTCVEERGENMTQTSGGTETGKKSTKRKPLKKKGEIGRSVTIRPT